MHRTALRRRRLAVENVGSSDLGVKVKLTRSTRHVDSHPRCWSGGIGRALEPWSMPNTSASACSLLWYCAGFYRLGNLACPKEAVAQIRTVRAKGGQNSGRTSDEYGGPGWIWTRDLFRLHAVGEEKNLNSVDFRGKEADVECWYYKALCLYHLDRKEEALVLCKKIDEIKEVINRKIFFYEDYIEKSSELMSKINIKSLNDKELK